jgi:hypothetical protein
MTRTITRPGLAAVCLLLVAALTSGCSDGVSRSAAAVCKVWNTDAVALHNKYAHDAQGSLSVGSVADLIAAPNDMAVLMEKMAAVAPNSIEPDFNALATAFHQESASESKAVIDPLGALASGLVGGLAVSGSEKHVDQYLQSNCQGSGVGSTPGQAGGNGTGSGSRGTAAPSTTVVVSGTWSGPKQVDPNQIDFYLLSCPSSAFCLALDSLDAPFTYSGGSWSGPQQNGLAMPQADIRNWNALSCASSTFCAVVGQGGNESSEQGVVATYSGGSWSGPLQLEPGGFLESVSCPSPTFCVATSDGGYAYTYSNGNWSSGQQLDPNSGTLAVSCGSPTFCVAVSEKNGDAYTYSKGTWSKGVLVGMNVDPNNLVSPSGLVGISCASPSFCLALDFSGDSYTYSGNAWSSGQQADNGGSLAGGINSPSCPTISFCMAVDAGGWTHVYANGV